VVLCIIFGVRRRDWHCGRWKKYVSLKAGLLPCAHAVLIGGRAGRSSTCGMYFIGLAF
jgi:hypothetical protein